MFLEVLKSVSCFSAANCAMCKAMSGTPRSYFQVVPSPTIPSPLALAHPRSIWERLQQFILRHTRSRVSTQSDFSAAGAVCSTKVKSTFRKDCTVQNIFKHRLQYSGFWYLQLVREQIAHIYRGTALQVLSGWI